jgi:voltage-gated potassium channel
MWKPEGADVAPLVEAGLAERALSPREVALMGVRSVGVIGLTLLVYALLPIDESSQNTLIAVLAGIGLALVLVVFLRQFGRIERAARPSAAAIEALLLVVGLFLTLFAFIYVSLSASDPGAFTQGLDKVAGIYFSVTVMTTVGFGDIAPVADVARVMVTLQMVLDIVLIGAVVKLLTLQARNVRERRQARPDRPPEQPAPRRDQGG